MIQYTLENIRHEPHDLDDELINLNFEVHVTEPTECVFEYFYSLSSLLNYIEKENPDFYSFWSETRRSTDVWGPAQNATIEAIGPEGQAQIYALLEKEMRETDYIEHFYNREVKYFQQLPEVQEDRHEDMAQKFEDLRETGLSLKEETRRYRLFCQTVEKQVREIALDIFPEISDLEPAQLEEYRYVYYDGINKMYNSLTEILNE